MNTSHEKLSGFLRACLCPSELNESVALSSSDRMHALSLKIVLLGKMYAGTPRFFPLGEQDPPEGAGLGLPFLSFPWFSSLTWKNSYP